MGDQLKKELRCSIMIGLFLVLIQYFCSKISIRKELKNLLRKKELVLAAQLVLRKILKQQVQDLALVLESA